MVSRERFEAYASALSANADAAWRATVELVGRYDALPANLLEPQLRWELAGLVREYGEVAARAAVEFYRAEREAAAPIDHYEPEMGSEVPGRIVAQDVSEAVQDHRRDDDRQAIANRLAGKAVKHAMWAAENTLVANARRDPAHPKWAIVPHPGACAWCVLLGSNDFMYASERTANSARHSNCKCAPVVDFDRENPQLDGYDPAAMRDAYSKCYETVRDEIDRRWDAMPAEERAKYTRNGKVSKDAFRRNMIVAEMSRRDREWLRTGLTVKPHYESEALRIEIEEKRPHEKTMIDLLSGSGFRLDVRESSRKFRDRKADSLIGGEKWEFKAPEGSSYLTVKNQLRSNLYGNDHSTLNPQSDKVVISNVRSAMTFDEMISGLEVAPDKQEGLNSEEIDALEQVLLLDRSGALKRVWVKQ